MASYDIAAVESKWQERWATERTFYVSEDSDRPKFYNVSMYPYPSGELHMGHIRNYTYADLITRYKRMRGYNVLTPMGWDSFGLPAENAAIDTGVHPRVFTPEQIDRMKVQLGRLGNVYDWDRELASHDPSYYRWTQWLFLQMYANDLAYRGEAPVNWCPKDQTVLANEQVIAGRCDRCNTEVVKRNLEQWFWAITKYADRLLDGIEMLTEWPDRVRVMQSNWIGRSEGARFSLPVVGHDDKSIEVYTTRPDTMFGMTFVVLAPDHPVVADLVAGTEHEAAVTEFVDRVARQSEIERMAAEEGLFIGVGAINPATNEEMPIYIADYVLLSYGTGAIMAVPGQDQRDWDFAKLHDLPIIRTVQPPDDFEGEAYLEDGPAINSQWLDGLGVADAKAKMIEWLESEGVGEAATQYRLRDWLVSRQRYWGCPIPIIYCDECGTVPVPDDQLPVVLPDIDDFRPQGRAPLAGVEEFVNTTCPECDGPATRETDTMDTFVDSSWYYMRYADPQNDHAIFDPAKVAHWLPIDRYMGGVEHAVLHLLYARFVSRVLYDLGYVKFEEPFVAMFTQGMLVKDGAKMSKSKGNVVAPDYYYDRYGADAIRLYQLFIGPSTDDAVWNDRGVEGTARFLQRVWRMGTAEGREWREGDETPADVEVVKAAHRTVKKVTEDIERLAFNTAVSALMELSNTLTDHLRSNDRPRRETFDVVYGMLLRMLAPMSPHVAHELWERTGGGDMVAIEAWPEWDPDLVTLDTVTMVIQVNGKVRDRVEVAADIPEDEAVALALQSKRAQGYLNGNEPRKVIARPPKIVNLVV